MFNVAYSAEERETVITVNDEDKKIYVYSLMPTVISKLKKVGEVPVKVLDDGAHYFELDFHQLSFRKKEKREMSEEQKQKAGERMRKMHSKKEKTD